MNDKEEWAMYNLYSLVYALVRYKGLPGPRTKDEAMTALRMAAPHLGEREVKKVEELLNTGESNGHE